MPHAPAAQPARCILCLSFALPLLALPLLASMQSSDRAFHSAFGWLFQIPFNPRWGFFREHLIGYTVANTRSASLLYDCGPLEDSCLCSCPIEGELPHRHVIHKVVFKGARRDLLCHGTGKALSVPCGSQAWLILGFATTWRWDSILRILDRTDVGL